MCRKEKKDCFWELMKLVSESDVKLFDLPSEELQVEGPGFRDIVLEDIELEESVPCVNCGVEFDSLVELKVHSNDCE